MRWFGEPWPSADERAGLCEDDKFKVETPVGEKCVGCGGEIVEGERGVLMAAYPEMEEGFFRDLPYTAFVCAEHIDCLIRSTAGPEFAGLVERRP